MLISVIIPTFNTGDFLTEAIDSLKHQTIGFENIEVILVDDASTDIKTLNLLENYEKTYENIKVVYLKSNSGFPGTPRNVGLNLATSDYVIFSDHDDTYENNAFEVMLNEITVNNADSVICNFNQVYSNKTIPFKSPISESRIEVEDFTQNTDILIIPAAIWTRLFRRDFLKENDIRFIEKMLAEDVHFAINTVLNGKTIYLRDFYGYNYKIRDSKDDKSTIHIRSCKYIDAMLNGYYQIDKLILNQNKTIYGEKIFNSHLTSWLYTIGLSELNIDDRLYLFTKAYDIFKKYYSEDSYFKGKYNSVAKCILERNFNKAVVQSFKIEKHSLISKIKNKLRR